MRSATRFLVRLCYHFSRALGFVHFRYHFGSGRVRVSKFISLYSFVVSLLLVAITPVQFQLRTADFMTNKARHLYQLLYMSMSAWRTAGLVLLLTFNWLKRREVVRVVVDFQRLHRQHFARLRPRVAMQCRFENALVRKFLLTFVNDAVRWLLVLISSRWGQWYVVASVGVVISAMNMMLNLMYLATQCLSWHYTLLNDELLRLMRDINAVSRLRRWHAGVFGRRYARLADKLDQLLAIRCELRALARRLNACTDVQLLCIMSHLYLYNIQILFVIYSVQKTDGLEVVGKTVANAVITLLINVAFYCDLREFVAANLDLLHAAQAGVRLLRQQLPPELLDTRLERSVEQFFLQEDCDPLEFPVLGLFKFNHASLFANFGSTFAHSIVIIQYDFQNF